MAVHPTALALAEGDFLVITWSDGARTRYSFRSLRDACPCATCREKRDAPPPPANLLPVLSPQEAAPLKVLGMKPVGNYAYSIAFSDGHDTGIYSFERLRELGEAVAEVDG
jgi:DUF971 family protein